MSKLWSALLFFYIYPPNRIKVPELIGFILLAMLETCVKSVFRSINSLEMCDECVSV